MPGLHHLCKTRTSLALRYMDECHVGLINESSTIRLDNWLVRDTEYTIETCILLRDGWDTRNANMHTDSKCTNLSFVWISFG